jgi:hypothetical protein
MKLAPLLCALSVCGPLALGAAAAETPARTAAAVANMARESTHAGASTGDGPKARQGVAAASPRRGSGMTARIARPLARSNADRLHSLHPANARAGAASTATRRVGSNAAASGNAPARGRGLPTASPHGLPTPPVASNAARDPPSVKAMVRGSIIGGPRAAGPGRLGGPATGGRQIRKKL